MAKKIAFWLILFVPVIVVLEAASYIVVKRSVPSRILHRTEHKQLLMEAAQSRPAGERPRLVRAAAVKDQADGLTLYHPVLGWDFPSGLRYGDAGGVHYSHGALGERRCCTSFDTTLIATYGDSFTYCAEVGDENTWQTFLGEKLRTNVLNFGVSGYGTDQALLKYELHGGGSPEIVILGVLPENINRVVNIYRPFYTYADPLKLTKPMFFKDYNKIRLIPNPVRSLAEVSKLDQEQFLEELGKFDYWYQLDKGLPKFTFPYTFSLYAWKDKVFAQLTAGVQGFSNRRIRHPWNLYDEDGPFSIMRYIADRFIATARFRGSEPLIVIMPYKDYITEMTDNRMVRAGPFIKYLSDKGYPFLDAVKSVAGMRPSKQDLDRWYRDHATAEGNKIFADILSQYLQAKYSCLRNSAQHAANRLP
ncbi:MAG: hypothetical protein WBG50_12940 [Desulfomonilaceae bacterium]